MKRSICLLAAVFAVAVVVAQAAVSTTTTGYISDSMCGAKHTTTGAACVKKCIEGGMKPVFVESRLLWRPRDRDGDGRCSAQEHAYRIDCRGKVGPSARTYLIRTRHAARSLLLSYRFPLPGRFTLWPGQGLND